MELFAMATGAAFVGLYVWLLRTCREADELEERVEELEEKIKEQLESLRGLVDIAEGVVDSKAQEYERNWQSGVTNILGYDMSDARKAGRDE